MVASVGTTISWTNFRLCKKIVPLKAIPMLYISYLFSFFTIDKMWRKVNALVYISLKRCGYKVSEKLRATAFKVERSPCHPFFCDIYFNRGRQLSAVVLKLLSINVMGFVIITLHSPNVLCHRNIQFLPISLTFIQNNLTQTSTILSNSISFLK